MREIAKRIGLDLLNPNHYLQLMGSLTDRLTYVWLLVEDQAKEYEINEDEFEDRLYGGNVAVEASFALMEECRDFFHRLGQEALVILTEKSIVSMRAGITRAQELIDSGELEQLLDKAASQVQALTGAASLD